MNSDGKNTIIQSQKAVITNQISKKNSNSAVTSLVFGIISLMLCWAFITSIITGIIGIITGIISISKKRDGFNLAVAGIATSSIGLLISFFLSAVTIAALIMG